MQGKFIGILALGFACLIGYAVVTQPRKSAPTSTRVNDEAFYNLNREMSYQQVVAILGEPQEFTTGIVVRVSKESPSWHSCVDFGLQEDPGSNDRLFLFRGVNDENVRVLFCQGRLFAAEYRLADARVLYLGPSVENGERMVAGSSIVQPPDELIARIDAFTRKQSLREQKLREARAQSQPPSTPNSVASATVPTPPEATPGPPMDPNMNMAERGLVWKRDASGKWQAVPADVPPPTPPDANSGTASPGVLPPGPPGMMPQPGEKPADTRTWTSADGTHTTEAKFVGASGGVARLQKKDGATVDVPRSKLSADDWKWVRENRHFFVSADFKSISLPSGAVLRADNIEPRAGWHDSLLSASSFVSYFGGGPAMGMPGQSIALIANRRGDKLDGPAASFYEDGHIKTIAEYRADRLCGALRIWDENKNRVLYSEYNRGNRHGITCLFADGCPWIVQEYERGSTLTEYYVDFKSGAAKLVPMDAITVYDEKLDFADAHEKLTDLDGVLQQGEASVRKAVQDQIKAMVAEARARQREGANMRLSGRKVQDNADWSANASLLLRNSGF